MSGAARADDKHSPSDNIQPVNPQNFFGQPHPHPVEDEDDRDDYDFQMNG